MIRKMIRKRTLKFTSLILLFLVNLNPVFSQEKSKSENSENQTTVPNVEKTYLHTDRSYYVLGESLWYKAYSVYAYNNILFDNSNVLYVELISPDSKIIARNKTRLESGLGHGDFKLTDSLGVKAGVYQLKAYTNWNRNFGDDFVFKKEIEIVDVFDQDALETGEINKPKAKRKEEIKNEVVEEGLTVQFFPEGGSLLENVSSIIAFKATDNYGNPKKIMGEIVDSKGNKIGFLNSLHDGMGKFVLSSAKNTSYIAKIISQEGDSIEVPLPKVSAEGYLIAISKAKGKEIITIKTNAKTLENNPNAPITIVGKTRGITYFEGTQPLTNTSLSFELPKADFPEGISQFTLYDADLRPHSERLVYLEKDHDFEVSMVSNKDIYEPKEKVDLTILSKSNEGVVVPASYSLSSTDMNGVKNEKDYKMNISSFFLMQSDIRGKVLNPRYYFDRSNPRRLYALDLLMLTQGWRDFIWKELPKVESGSPYLAEKGFTVSGRVKQLFGDKPKPNSSISMGLMNNGQTNLLLDVSDDQGAFKFENLVFMGNATMMLNTQSEKGKNKGMFELDSICLPPMSVGYTSNGNRHSAQLNTVKENVLEKHVLFGVAPDNLLDEVEITAKNKVENRSKFGNADHTFVPDDITRSFSDMYQMLQYSLPGVMVSGGTVRFNKFSGPALIVIDDVPTVQSDLDFITPDDVAMIESLTTAGASIFGSKGGNGVILIYTKEGEYTPKKSTKFHSIIREIQGFYEARVYYAPDLEEPSFEVDNSAAIRNTLHWAPYVHPDENGEAKVSYYNSEVNTSVKVTLEGITADGIPVVVKTYYTVEK